MNYKLIYDNLIKKRQTEPYDDFGEFHHTIPKCMGGNDLPENIIKLSIREHFFAHLLLAKIYPHNQKILTAIFFMSNNRRYSSKEYSWMKKLYRLYGNCHKGKTYEQIMGYEKAKKLKKKRSDFLSVMNDLGVVGGKGNNNPMSKNRSGKSDIFYSEKSKKAYATRKINGNNCHTENTKNKIKESCKNINKKKVYIYDKDKNLICICESLKEASIYLNKPYTKLSTWIKHNSEKIINNSYYVRYTEL